MITNWLGYKVCRRFVWQNPTSTFKNECDGIYMPKDREKRGWYACLCLQYVMIFTFVFQCRIKNASVYVCIFFISVLINCCSISGAFYWIHRVTFFSLLRLFSFFSLSLFKYPDFLMLCSSIFLFHWIFQDAENANMEPWTPGTIEQRGRTPECFYSWRKCFSPPLHPH